MLTMTASLIYPAAALHLIQTMRLCEKSSAEFQNRREKDDLYNRMGNMWNLLRVIDIGIVDKR